VQADGLGCGARHWRSGQQGERRRYGAKRQSDAGTHGDRGQSGKNTTTTTKRCIH
jgi:hypothetical protein